METKITDGGRDRVEYSDCTVRALAICENIPYRQAHDLLEMCGRKNFDGVYRRHFFPMITNYLSHPHYFLKHQITLKTFIKLHPKGKFYITIRGHATALINGVIFDMEKPNENKRVVAYAEFGN